MGLEKIIQSRLEEAISNGDEEADIEVCGKTVGYVDLSMYYMLMEAIQIGIRKEKDNLNDSELAKILGEFSSKHSDKLFPFEMIDDDFGD